MTVDTSVLLSKWKLTKSSMDADSFIINYACMFMKNYVTLREYIGSI